MQTVRGYIQGLDYRSNDNEAPLGVCRELVNLYPYGDIDKPQWKPAMQAQEFLSLDHEIIDAAIWNLTNHNPYLVYVMRNSSVGRDELYLRELDPQGNILLKKDPVYCTSVCGSHNDRECQFTQISDVMIVSLKRQDTAEGFFELRMVAGVPAMTPFNLPNLPKIETTPTFRYNEGSESAPLYNVHYFGFRYAYELNDGSYVRLSNVVITESSYKKIRSTDQDANEETRVRSTYGPRKTGSERGRIPEIIKSDEDFDVIGLVYFQGAASWILKGSRSRGRRDETTPQYVCKVHTPTGLGSEYQGIIRGVAVFISEPKLSPEEVVADAVFYKYGVIEGIFDPSTGTKDLKIDFVDTDLMTYPLLEEDNLMAHSIYPGVIGTYNKMLLMGGVTIDFTEPFSLDGIIGATDTTPEFVYRPVTNITLSDVIIEYDDETYTLTGDSNVTWDNPQHANKAVIEGRLSWIGLSYKLGPNGSRFPIEVRMYSEWKQIDTVTLSGDRGTSTVQITEVIGDSFIGGELIIEVRIKTKYENVIVPGESDWAYASHTA